METIIENKVPQIKGKITEIPLPDKTLTKSGFSADAKVVGDALENHMTLIEKLQAEIKALKGEENDVT